MTREEHKAAISTAIKTLHRTFYVAAFDGYDIEASLMDVSYVNSKSYPILSVYMKDEIE